MTKFTRTDLAEATERDPRWREVLARSAEADGTFVYSVRTTGVYCRPSCAARQPRPENVRFHATREQAERAGFRPCRRCRPDQHSAARDYAEQVTRACRLIESSDRALTLEVLARKVGVSPFHFHRVFKAVTGLTPRGYATAQRGRRVRAELGRNGSVTRAIYEAGYTSNSRFYDEAGRMLGMTPTDYRAGGVHAEIRYGFGECSLGVVLVARSDRGICAILLGDDRDALAHDLHERFPRAELIERDAEFEDLVAKVVEFVEAPKVGLALPLDVRGTAFQQRVWQALRDIPAGATVTYSDIAARIGAPRSVRAVAGACAANGLAIAIPCHRVVASKGRLAGYRWGVERKRSLLEREGAR
jgi:AraC family transcriptional regulator of adaptative response/methylated-DNA-[protein]-cysteine methyltransferase